MNDLHRVGRVAAWLILSCFLMGPGSAARAQARVGSLTFESAGGRLDGSTKDLLVTAGQPVAGRAGRLTTGFAFTASNYFVSGVAIEGPGDGAVPRTFELHQNYPNPFNPVTTVTIDVAQTGPVKLDVFDSLGRLRRVALDATLESGTHSITIDAHDLESGVYVYRVRVGSSVAARRMVLLK